MSNNNIAEKLKMISLSSDTDVFYGNIKDNIDVKRAMDMFKHLNIETVFK